jgi:hypothetical protein
MLAQTDPFRISSVKHMEEKLKRLRWASEEGDVAAVRELLESGEVDVNAVDDYMVRSFQHSL